MVGNLADRCAFAASGHSAAAPPSSVMNWRRFYSVEFHSASQQATLHGREAYRTG
jgi:hypothetical protein